MKNSYISQEGYKKLKKELAELKNIKRREVAERIQIAREQGDLSENGEYEEAKDEQAFIEGRILELEKKLKKAIIVKKRTNQYKIGIGSRVHLMLGEEKVQYEIVGSNEADPSIGKISNESPLGDALKGKKKDDQVEVIMPNGRKNKYKVVDIE